MGRYPSVNHSEALVRTLVGLVAKVRLPRLGLIIPNPSLDMEFTRA